MLALFAAALLALAPAVQDPAAEAPAPIPAAGPGEWILLEYAWPPGPLRHTMNWWISAADYGAGPNAEGLVRVRVVSPDSFDAELRPTRIIDVVRELDCVNRRERFWAGDTPEEWQVLPDFVPGAREIYSLCSPQFMASRQKETSLAAAIARSQEYERLFRTKVVTDHD